MTEYIIAVCVVLSAVIGWPTTAAQLADMEPRRRLLLTALAAIVKSVSRCPASRRAGRDAAMAACRPLVRLAVATCVFASAPVALCEVLIYRAPGVFCGVLCLSLAAHVAACTPCPWFRYITRGDRRRAQQAFIGDDKRARR